LVGCRGLKKIATTAKRLSCDGGQNLDIAVEADRKIEMSVVNLRLSAGVSTDNVNYFFASSSP
jgi:hypothetical protein